jgi:hypothetical protein
MNDPVTGTEHIPGLGDPRSPEGRRKTDALDRYERQHSRCGGCGQYHASHDCPPEKPGPDSGPAPTEYDEWDTPCRNGTAGCPEYHVCPPCLADAEDTRSDSAKDQPYLGDPRD